MARCGRSVSLAIIPVIFLVVACGGYHEPGASAENTNPDLSTAISQADPPLTIWKQVSAGRYHACAISTEGKLYCWGANSSGQLGFVSSGALISIPTQVGKVSTWKAVATGYSYTCAIQGTGALYCWGENSEGQLGVKKPGGIPKLYRVGGTALFTKVAGALYTTCAIKKDGSLWCWGYNGFGQVGNGTVNDTRVPVRVGTAGNWKDISVGRDHGCATRTDGTLWCWGSNQYGQLGVGDTADRHAPRKVTAAKNWTAVSVSDFGSCGPKKDHTLWCWGGGGGVKVSPVQVTSVTDNDWVKLDMGGFNTCAIKNTGALWCWQTNDFGQLGQGDQTYQANPTLVSSEVHSSISVGVYLICAVKGDKSIICAGGNNFGQVGNGLPGQKRVPTLAYSAAFTNIHAGSHTTCATVSTYAYCSGYNEGALGNGDMDNRRSFVLTDDSQNWSQVASGFGFSCFANDSSKLYCSGEGSYGQCGNGVAGSYNAPVAVSGDTAYMQYDLGDYHACAIRSSDFSLWCWGQNEYGQLGDGSTANRNVPTQVGILTGYSQVAAGGSHSCAIKGGAIYCWGRNFVGQLGNGNTADQKSPVLVGTAGLWVSVAAGYNHTCARKTDGTIWCWGSNYFGELGDGTLTASNTFVQAGTDTNWSPSIALGAYFSCAKKSTGAIYCWGDNRYGQLAKPGEMSNVPTPQQVGTDTDWLLLTAGSQHVCATKTGGIYCWGDNLYGQIPDSSAWHTYFQAITAKSP